METRRILDMLILGFHVTSEKTEITNFKVLHLSGENYF